MSAPHAALLMVTPPVGVTWNPADSATLTTLSNGNLTIAGAAGRSRATVGHAAAGKYYFEILVDVVNAGTNSPSVGVMLASANINTTGGSSVGAWTIQSTPAFTFGNGAYKSSGGTLTVGMVVGVAVDLAASSIWFARNNTWILSGDPSAGTNATWTTLSSALLKPWCRAASGGQATARFSSSAWTYAAPTGFVEW